MTQVQVTRSLEDIRREQLLEVNEFAQRLGLTEQTYRRLLAEPGKARMATKRQVRDALGVPSPYLIAELSPEPSPVLQAQVRAAIEDANEHGWIAVDPDTDEPTGEIFDGKGNLLSS